MCCDQHNFDDIKIMLPGAITQVTNWGVTVPVKGFENQRFDPWFELAAGQCLFGTGQLSHSLEPGSGWERFWKAEDGNVVQFFGFDNGYFYALLFPALLLAYDEEINLPKVFVNNEFYRLEGDKFSTSRGHAI
ncbi:MAG: class I tRNA ligase family protein, partial [Chloroflexota bacterium]